MTDEHKYRNTGLNMCIVYLEITEKDTGLIIKGNTSPPPAPANIEEVCLPQKTDKRGPKIEIDMYNTYSSK